MSEKTVAVIANIDSGYEILLEQMNRVFEKNMEPASVHNTDDGGYDFWVWDHSFIKVKPKLYLADENFEQAFVNEHKNWCGMILVFEGTAFDVDAEDEDEYLYKVSRALKESKQFRVWNTFARADKAWELPPVCIVATKKRADLPYEDKFYQVMKDKCQLFFDNTFRKNPPVSIVASSVLGIGDSKTESIAKGVETVAFFMAFSAIIKSTYEKRVQWQRYLNKYQSINSYRLKLKSDKQRMEQLEQLQEPLHSDAFYLLKGHKALVNHWEEKAVIYDSRRMTDCRDYMYALAVYYNFYDWEFSPVKQDHWNDMRVD